MRKTVYATLLFCSTGGVGVESPFRIIPGSTDGAMKQLLLNATVWREIVRPRVDRDPERPAT